MKKNYFANSVLQAYLLFFMIITTNAFAQVGIGTIVPDVSSVLDVSSTTKGMLTPRMTTAQRSAIAAPADGLMVYDTDLKSFYHYNTAVASWTVLSSGGNGRTMFKRIKGTDVLATVLAAEKAAGGNAKYVLDTHTYYEINGVINVDLPIDLNNAYVSGQDANEDVLARTSGNLFDGATGGSIRNVTMQVTGGGKVFNLSGANTQNLLLRDAVVAGCSNVGSITGFGLVFVSIVQYVANTTGIVYEGIKKLLISNAAWFGTNTGTYETLKGTFGLIEKQGGFSEVNDSAIGLDVSSNPIVTGDAVLETVVFTGTNTAGYVKGYTPAIYSGYNFDNNWSVRCAGIPNEVDAVSTGFLYDSSNTSATTTVATTQGTDYKVNTNTTVASNLFRVKSLVNGRLTYIGKKTRTFQVNSSVSFIESSSAQNYTNATYVFYIVKITTGGAVVALPETETFIDTNSGFVQAFPITGTVSLNTNESVEIHLKRINTGTKINVNVYSLNMSLK